MDLTIKSLGNYSIKLCLLLLNVCIALSGEKTDTEIESHFRRFNIEDAPVSPVEGDSFAVSVQNLALEQREEAIFEEISMGNIPDFLRTPIPVKFSKRIGEINYQVSFFVMPDYLAIGTDENYFLMPMTPILAQRIMDKIGGILPTKRMVDLIWSDSKLKLEPTPIKPSNAMVTIPVFDQHNKMVRDSRAAYRGESPLGSLVSGHKKDIILSRQSTIKKVVIYGWHHRDGQIIQPTYSGHVNWYVDYSHGVRVVMANCIVNDKVMDINNVLLDPILFSLFSDESGPHEWTRYDTSSLNYR